MGLLEDRDVVVDAELLDGAEPGDHLVHLIAAGAGRVGDDRLLGVVLGVVLGVALGVVLGVALGVVLGGARGRRVGLGPFLLDLGRLTDLV
ncbi:hypothetical protein D9V37_05055 [Nocardioides mangrovicus]|uniref:Uncharacterized protein n=1 Tax=Nocardioides mangrovicus TaxID=2478913 RepID=A0A3L8P4Y3_9ACTN|nr:hypothetical protein D9V37_05055 [Nocardioides mangrovicus]